MKKSIKACALLGLSFSLFFGASYNKADASSMKLHLPAGAPTWTVYKTGHPLVKSNPVNIAGVLAPSKFGGLTYDIVGTVGPNSYVINTQSFGQVEIYAGPGTGAQIIGGSVVQNSPAPAQKVPAKQASTTGSKIYLPADASTWTVYKMGHPLVKSNPANIAGVIAPSKFGGLTYDILGTVGSNSYVINTDKYGQVEIYGGPETGAQIIGGSGSIPVVASVPIIASVPVSQPSQVSISNAQTIINYAKRYMGMPYVWGGSNPSTSFDCSGFVYWVFKNNGYDIYRTTVEGYWNMSRVQRDATPQIGDMVFLQNTYRVGPSHIGIYIGNGQMIDANSSRGIAIDNLNTPYYQSHLLGYGHFKY